MSLPDERGGTWTFLTGHGHVLVEIARDPGARIRDIARNREGLARTAGRCSTRLAGRGRVAGVV
jgi:hypothetical protein